MTGTAIVAVVAAVQAAIILGAVHLLALGFRNGDRPGDPRIRVRALGGGNLQVLVQNPSDGVVLVAVSRRRRLWFPADRRFGLSPLAARRLRLRYPAVRRPSLDDFLGAVGPGATGCWTLAGPDMGARLRVQLGLPDRRLRARRHVLPAIPAQGSELSR